MENIRRRGNGAIAPEPEGLTVKQIKAVVIKKWYLFAAFAFAGVVIAYVYSKLTPETYKLSTTLLVKHDKTQDLTAVFQEARAMKSNSSIQDNVGVIRSFSLNLRTMQDLNWQYSWFRKKFVGKEDLYRNTPFDIEFPNESAQTDMVELKINPRSEKEYIVSCDSKKVINGQEVKISFESKAEFGKPFKNNFFQFILKRRSAAEESEPDYILVFNNLSKLALAYKEKIEVGSADEESNLIRIELETSQPQRDADYLNTLSSLYIQHGLDEKNRMANNTVRFIDNLISGVNDSLQVAGNTFTNYRSRNKTVNLGQEASSVVEQMKALDNEESQVSLKLDYYNSLKYYLDNKDQIKDLVAPSIEGVTDDDLTGLVAKMNALFSKREVLSYTVQEKNPTMIAVNNEIAFTQKMLNEKVNTLVEAARLELRNIKDRQSKVGREISRLPRTEQELIGIKRNFDINNELFTFLLQRRAEAEIARASNNPDAEVLDPASESIAELLGPKKMRNIISGFLGGIVLAFLFVVVKEYLTEKLTSIDEIQQRLAFPVIASISENKFSGETPVMQYPRSAITESFRGLRINLQNQFPDYKVIAVHSYISGEGKSFVALNTALVIAMSRKRVLLVDGDLRKPRLHQTLKLENEVGLSDFLEGTAPYDEILTKTSHDGLTFVCAGTTGNTSSELVSPAGIEKFLTLARKQFDFIVFDNSPIGIVTEATNVGVNADINLFLLRVNYSLKEQTDEINRYYSEGVLKNVTVAVNGVKQRAGYGYYNESKKSKVVEA